MQPENSIKPNTQLLDALLQQGVINQDQHSAVVVYVRTRQMHVEEVVLQMNFMEEPELLKFLAAFYKTQYVSTKKLSEATIDRATLALIPHRLATRLLVFPVVYNALRQELSILGSRPDDPEVQKAILFATRLTKIKWLIARPAAIRAAILKHYEGKTNAFTQVRDSDPAMGSAHDLMEQMGESLLSEGHSLGNVSRTQTLQATRNPTMRADRAAVSAPPADNAGNMLGMLTTANEFTARPAVPLPPQAVPVPGMPNSPSYAQVAAPQLPPHLAHQPAAQQQAYSLDATLVGAPPGYVPAGYPQQGYAPQGYAPQGHPPRGPIPIPVAEARSDTIVERALEKVAASRFAFHDYLETLNVLVALLENDRGELRGHSLMVARITRRVCERLELSPDETDGILVAAYLHDIGKASAYHLTALNVAEYEGHRAQARKSHMTPVRLLEAVRLPDASLKALTQLYERFDGTGFPDRLTGKEISLGARVIAIVETFADLTGHARNPFRKKLSSQEAWDVLAKYKNRVFDPNLVDVFKTVVLGDDLKAKLLADSKRALLVDADREETTVLELRLAERGFDVTIARTSIEAEKALESGEFDVVISEVDISPIDGFELLKKVAAANAETAFVFLSKRTEGDTVSRGFQLGAADYITKPASPDVVALKIRQVLDNNKRKRGGRGVSGSLEEMGLPDVVQILYHGRKSGKLSITSGGKRGEILFSEGQIFNASFGSKEREDAFYDMLSLSTGEFELDPNVRPDTQVIQMNPESLLLEGMRRLDEEAR